MTVQYPPVIKGGHGKSNPLMILTKIEPPFIEDFSHSKLDSWRLS
jgi:hypothetical protein